MKIDKYSYRSGEVRFLRMPCLRDIDFNNLRDYSPYEIMEYDYNKPEDRHIIEMYLELVELRNKVKELKEVLR